MTQEEFNTEVNLRLTVQDEKFNSMLARIDATNQRVDDLITEMREQNADLRQEMRERDAQSREDMREIRKSISEMGSHVRNISYATIAAVGAMVVTVLLNLPKG